MKQTKSCEAEKEYANWHPVWFDYITTGYPFDFQCNL